MAHILQDATRFLRQLRALFALSHSRTLSTFTVHRVPGGDYLR